MKLKIKTWELLIKNFCFRSQRKLMEIVKKLMVHMDKAKGTTYRDELLSKIIDICSQNNYQYITNFEW